MTETRDLTPKEGEFVAQYLIDLNATKAAIRAGYSEKSARTLAARLLAKVHIQDAIASARAELAVRTNRTVDDVMADIEKVRVSCMQEVEVEGAGVMALLAPKEALRALELEGKHRGAFPDRIDLSNRDGSLKPQVIRIVAAKTISHGRG